MRVPKRCIALLIAAIATSVSAADEKTLKIGYMVPMTGSWDIGRSMAAAVPVALDALDPSLMGGYKLEYTWRNSSCAPGHALAALTSLLAVGVDVLIGPACSVACEPTQLLAATTNIPQASTLFLCPFKNLFIELYFPDLLWLHLGYAHDHDH